MVTREMRLGRARTEARRVLGDFGATSPGHIDLERIAAATGAEIVRDELEGATARVIQIGTRARIFVSSRISDPGSIRFSIAHELAHLFLRHQVQGGDARRVIERVCSPLRADGSNPEREASVFASELLMPESMVAGHCAVVPTTSAPVQAISRTFGTSLLASALRFVELTAEPCAVVYSELGRVGWCKRSATFGAWIPKGRPVDPSSAAFDYFDRGLIDHATRVVPAATWLSRRANAGTRATIHEHPTILPELGAVFSLLWMPRDTAAHVAQAA